MEHPIDLDSWEQLEQMFVDSLRLQSNSESASTISKPLFRGQASSEWRLETTLERAQTSITSIADYFRFLSAAKPQLETFTGRRWPDLDLKSIQSTFGQYDSLYFSEFPAYELCVYARHHGFPSPLLDWTRSPYIAAFFAFQAPVGKRVAIWMYQEYAGFAKASSSNEPQIKNLGPYVTSHPRHFLQQGQYTLAAQYSADQWNLAGHHSVFELNREGQDQLFKITIPSSEQSKVLRRLDLHNINAYSLLQTEDALLQTIAARLLPRYRKTAA